MPKFIIRPRIFLTILLATVVVWYFLRFNDVYDYIIEKDIEFVNIPAELNFSENAEPTSLQFKVRGKGIYLHFFQLFSGALALDFKEDLTPTTGTLSYTLSNKRFKLPYGLNPVEIYTQSLDLSDKILSEKKVPLYLDTQILYADNYVPLDSIGFSPDSVVVRGVYSKISNINKITVRSEPLLIAEIESQTEFDLNDYLENIIVTPETVYYRILADQVVEGDIKLPLQSNRLNITKSDAVQLPDSVAITYRVASRFRDSLNVGDFRARLILKGEADDELNQKVDVVLLHKALESYKVITLF